MVINRPTRVALGLSVAALFVWLVLRDVKFSEVGHVLVDAKLGWIAAATALFIGGYACRIERWRLMLTVDNPSEQWAACAVPFLASFAANNLLPLRAGDVLRVFVFNRRLLVVPGVVAATLFVERLLDMLMVLISLGVALTSFDLSASRYAGVSGAGLIVLAAVLLLTLLFAHHSEPVLRRIAKWVEKYWPAVGRRLLVEMDWSLVTLKSLTQGCTMLSLITWSVIAWGLEAVVYYFAALALPGLVSPLGGYLALPLTAFATLIPSAPGYLGTFEFFAVRAMTGVGNSISDAAAYAVLIHALIWVPQTLAGGICWLRISGK